MANNVLAPGFVNLESLMAERVTTVGVQTVYDAIRESAQEWTRQTDAMLSTLVEPTTDHQVRYFLPGSGTLQPLDEMGNPKPIVESGYYDVAFPIQGGGTAWGAHRVSRALMTVEYANRMTLEAMRRDADWMRRHMLAALLDNATWTFADPEYGNLTIQPLANGDAVTYVRNGGAVSVDTHHLFQAAAIADATDPYDDIYSELMEHPSNSGPVICYIATSLVATTKALTAFVPVVDPDILVGVAADRLVGGINPGFGDEVLGKVDNCWIVEWKALPAGYIIAHAQGGGPVLRMRQYPAPELQGFFPETFSPDGNIQETRMLRYAGFGVVNRIACVGYFVGGGAWAIPTGYDAPLGV